MRVSHGVLGADLDVDSQAIEGIHERLHRILAAEAALSLRQRAFDVIMAEPAIALRRERRAADPDGEARLPVHLERTGCNHVHGFGHRVSVLCSAVGCIHRARTARIAPWHWSSTNVESLAGEAYGRSLDRAEKAKQYGYISSWDTPRHETPIQKRRLRLASTLFLVVAQCGGRTELSGGEPYGGHANGFVVRVGDQTVSLSVAVVETKRRTGKGADAKTTTHETIQVILDPGEGRRPDGRAWEDGERRLEDQLREIAVTIIMRGEEEHRATVLHRHQWRIEARAALIEQRRRDKEDAERQERERLAKLERERVERLLGEAEALRKAMAIRQYVTKARAANTNLPEPVPDEQMTAWAGWALGVADSIDPVRSGNFRGKQAAE
jgi:hypothetical protein